MKTRKAPFAIPAINNQKEVLAKYLGIDSSVDSEFSKIAECGTYGKPGKQVHCFLFDGKHYSVAHNSVGLDVNRAYSFNSSLWNIRTIDDESPYQRFRDDIVIEQLQTIMPEGFKVLALNQKELKVLFLTADGYLAVYKYSSHWPDDIPSYYLRGDVTYSLIDVTDTFGSEHTRGYSIRTL